MQPRNLLTVIEKDNCSVVRAHPGAAAEADTIHDETKDAVSDDDEQNGGDGAALLNPRAGAKCKTNTVSHF